MSRVRAGVELLVTWAVLGAVIGIIGVFTLVAGLDKSVLRAGDLGKLLSEIGKGMSPGQLIVVSILDCVLVLAAYIVLGLINKKQSGVGPPRKRKIFYPVLFGVAAALIAVLVSPWSTGKSFMSTLDAKGMASVVVLLALTLPPIEEIYYRGIVLPRLVVLSGRIAGVVLGTVWFAGVHYFQLRGDEFMLLPIIALGAVCSVQRVVWNSLWPPIITHFVYNAVMVCL